MHRSKSLSSLAIVFAILATAAFLQAQPSAPVHHGRWQPLKNQLQFPAIYDQFDVYYGPGGASAPLLLTDGSVLIQNVGVYAMGAEVFKLTPDINGSYINGTWSQLASKPYISSGGAQAVLADGRVLIEGGEYSNYNFNFLLTNQGAIYDPVADAWQSVDPPSFFVDLYPPRAVYAPHPIGDSASVVLADGTFMLEDKMSRQAALLDLNSMTWTETGTATKHDLNDEEGLTLLPDGTVLTIDCYTDYIFHLIPHYPANPTNTEIYNPATGEWTTAGSTIQSLTDPFLAETGPAMLMPNGKVFAIGSTGVTGLYDVKSKTWSEGPMLPISPQGYQYTVQDGPSVLLPNGHVFLAASGGYWPYGNYSNPPVGFFEFDGVNLIPEPTIPNAANDASYSLSLLPLPNGQVLAVDSTSDVEIYTPAPTSDGDRPNNIPHNNIAPTIVAVPRTLHPGGSYTLKGRLLNGISQACAFGDELQCATNYPLVRITYPNGHVYYSRTHDHSSMGVGNNGLQSTQFDVPANQETGYGMLEVVANGIPSRAIPVQVQ